MTYTTVKSDLARRDVRDTESDRCTSRKTYRGTTYECSRPRSGHRVHENGGWLQWEKGDK